MGEYVVKLPDVGEGVAEAELVEWHVKAGDLVREDDVLVAVMTDKATVEIPSPVDGKVIRAAGEVGETVAVGSELVRIEVGGEGNVADGAPSADPDETAGTKTAGTKTAGPEPEPDPDPEPGEKPAKAAPSTGETEAEPSPAVPPREKTRPARTATPVPGGPPRPEGEKPLAAPSVRKRAREGGIDLRQVPGTGPAGRITHPDLDVFFRRGPGGHAQGRAVADETVTEIKVVGLRRRIAEKMALSKSRIPHYSIVEEIDVSALETLRARLNETERGGRARLTLLPFLMCAMVRALRKHPELNARYDDEAGVVHQHGGIHIGIATQTDAGLLVPVVRHVETRDLHDCASEISRLSQAARNGQASRDELGGSTITITSLGPLGAIATTPVINHPEVAIVGVNKIAIRPLWDGTQFVPRKMMNLSSSFDHRVVDGWVAANFVRDLKLLLETPAMIFVEA